MGGIKKGEILGGKGVWELEAKLVYEAVTVRRAAEREWASTK